MWWITLTKSWVKQDVFRMPLNSLQHRCKLQLQNVFLTMNAVLSILSFLPDCLFVHLPGSILLWKYSEFTFSSILAGNLQIDSLVFSKILGTVGIEIQFNLTNWLIIGRTFLWHFEWSVMLFLASRPRIFFKMYLWHDLFLPKITLEDCTWKLFNDFY